MLRFAGRRFHDFQDRWSSVDRQRATENIGRASFGHFGGASGFFGELR